MKCGQDWLFKPMLPPYSVYKYESLKDGSLSLFDIVKIHEAIDVQAHNKRVLNPR
jgi:hypothetical protein